MAVTDPKEELRAIYAAKREAGLVDVKFVFSDLSDASLLEVARELVDIDKAIAAGKTVPLDFGDLCLKAASHENTLH